MSTRVPATRGRISGTGMRRTGASRRATVVPLAIAATVALVLGIGLGRLLAPTPEVAGLAAVNEEVVPLSVDADGLWTAGAGDLPAIGEQLAELRRVAGTPEDPTSDRLPVAAISTNAEPWREAYDSVLRRMIGVDVAPPARPVQRQFVSAIALSRDALDLLVAAAEAEDPQHRRDLSSEALRLRTRGEQLTQTARASLADLTGSGTSGVAEPADLPTLQDLR